MNGIPNLLLLAQTASRGTPQPYLDWPTETEDVLILVGLVALAIVSVIVYLRDTSGLGAFWRIFLPVLRVAVILGLIVMLLAPHTRSSEEATSPSRVVVLIDTSPSMDLPNHLPGEVESPADEEATLLKRHEAARELMARTDLIETLRKRHEVHVFTFGDKLHDRVATYPRNAADTAAAKSKADETVTDETAGDEADPQDPANDDSATDEVAEPAVVEVDWSSVLEPRGVETRIGDAVRDVIAQYAGETFAGIVVVSDGANNAGNDPDNAKSTARKYNVRLVSVGVGSTTKLANLRLTGLQMPTRAQVDDPYDIKAYVQGQNVAAGTTVEVQLWARPAEVADAEMKPVLGDDGTPVSEIVRFEAEGREEEVVFERLNSVDGEIEYEVRVVPPNGVTELRDDDNAKSQKVTISKDPTRVLLIAGGPMREYRFVRDLLARHKGVETTLWLQTIEPDDLTAVSQDANNPLLISFPDKADLFRFDVVIAFDADWSRLDPDQRKLMEQWVGQQSGGLILVAGDVSTKDLVTADETYEPIKNLYPVVLEQADLNLSLDLSEQKDAQPWPPEFTRDGQNVEFLQLAGDPAESAQAWKDFEGYYRVYPTNGVKGGTVVYSYFADPRARSASGQHVLLASQFYEGGRILYLGSPETWRLRGVDPDYYERFWTKAIREVGQGRLRRGGSRASLRPERDEYFLGENVVVLARVLDANFDPVEVETIELDVTDPNGNVILPKPKLRPEPNQPGVYRGDFRAAVASPKNPYAIAYTIPGSEDREEAEVRVSVPNLEMDQPERNARLLRDLSKEQDREFYVDVEEAALNVPTFLTDRTQKIIVNERRNELWDKSWILYLFVALLSLEWLSRKLLKLA